MAEKLPTMDWGAPNLTDAFNLFKQKVELYFQIKNIEGENQIAYILRGVDDEGLKRYNSWTLTDAEKKKPEEIWKRFKEQLEPSENFRVARLKLHYFYQKPDETLDSFVTRCRQQALKCDFTVASTDKLDEKQIDERILEQIIASTPIEDFQRELLASPKGYKLSQALELGRSYEATDHSISQLKNIGAKAATTNVSYVKKSTCKNCGKSHQREPKDRCPAYYSTCNSCGKKGH